MAERPRIGVTRWNDMALDRVEPYWERLREAQADVVDLESDRPEGEWSQLDGFVLTGGIDIDPSLYGEKPHPTVKNIDPARDAFELSVLSDALERDVPVLAVCRGHQLLNVALGGSLLQHIENGEHVAHMKAEGRPSRWHGVRIAEGSRLAEVLGPGEVEVNSRHHQAVTPETLAPGLDAIASSPDGLIDGVESRRHRWVVGVQWHPERPEPEHPAFAPMSRLLFAALVRAATPASQRA